MQQSWLRIQQDIKVNAFFILEKPGIVGITFSRISYSPILNFFLPNIFGKLPFFARLTTQN